jgi:preprotein translocase subunit SecY
MAAQGQTLAGVQAGLSELRNRLLFVLIALIVYRVSTHSGAGHQPGTAAPDVRTESGRHPRHFNMFSGGALERMSLRWA